MFLIKSSIIFTRQDGRLIVREGMEPDFIDIIEHLNGLIFMARVAWQSSSGKCADVALTFRLVGSRLPLLPSTTIQLAGCRLQKTASLDRALFIKVSYPVGFRGVSFSPQPWGKSRVSLPATGHRSIFKALGITRAWPMTTRGRNSAVPMRRGGDTERSRQIKDKGTAPPRWRDYHAGTLVIQAAVPPFRLNEHLSTLGQAFPHLRRASLTGAVSVLISPE